MAGCATEQRGLYFTLDFFSKNLLNFEELTQTNDPHIYGDVVTFNESLTAIGGKRTSKVEVYEGGSWNYQTIQPIGNNDGRLGYFTSLAIKNQLYVFGNISVLIFFVKIKLFITKVDNVLVPH